MKDIQIGTASVNDAKDILKSQSPEEIPFSCSGIRRQNLRLCLCRTFHRACGLWSAEMTIYISADKKLRPYSDSHFIWGKYSNSALPIISLFSTNLSIQKRESTELFLLSPMTK